MKDNRATGSSKRLFFSGGSDANHYLGHLHPVLAAQHGLLTSCEPQNFGQKCRNPENGAGTTCDLDCDPHHLRQQRDEPVSLRHLLSVRVSCLAFSIGSGLTESLTDFEKQF